jgi:hypothetical protein
MLFDNLEGVGGGVVFAGRLALAEAGNTQVVVGAVIVGASDANLRQPCQYTAHRPCTSNRQAWKQRTVAVMSAEQMSQMYLMPPSVVLTAVFFLMRPMVAHVWAWARGVVPGDSGVNMVA